MFIYISREKLKAVSCASPGGESAPRPTTKVTRSQASPAVSKATVAYAQKRSTRANGTTNGLANRVPNGVPVGGTNRGSNGVMNDGRLPMCEPVDKEIPGDLGAFYGHPFSGMNGDKDESGNARALLHEFENLPEISAKVDIAEYLS